MFPISDVANVLKAATPPAPVLSGIPVPTAQVPPVATAVPDPHGPGLPALPTVSNTGATTRGPSGQFLPQGVPGEPVVGTSFRDPTTGRILSNVEAARRAELIGRMAPPPEAVPAQPVPAIPVGPVPQATPAPEAPKQFDLPKELYEKATFLSHIRTMAEIAVLVGGDAPKPNAVLGDLPLALGITLASGKEFGVYGLPVLPAIVIVRAILTPRVPPDSPPDPTALAIAEKLEERDRVLARVELAKSRMIQITDFSDP